MHKILQHFNFISQDQPRGVEQVEKQLEEQYKRNLLLQKINAVINSSLRFEEVSQIVVDNVVEALNYVGGVLLLTKDFEQELYSYTVSSTPSIARALRLLKQSFSSLHTPIDQPENLIGQAAKTGQSYYGDKLSDFVAPVIKAEIADAMQRITGLKTVAAIPIKVKGNVIGVFTVSGRKPRFEDDEKEILETFTNQVGVAIENARLFKKTEEQVRELEERTKTLLALHEASKIILETSEVKDLIQNVLNSIPNKDLGYVGGILTLINPENDYIYVEGISKTGLSEEASKLLGRTPVGLGTKLSESTTLIAQVAKEGKPVSGVRLRDFICPPVSRKVADAIQQFTGVKVVASFPVSGGWQKTAGILTFGLSKEAHLLTDQDRQMMATLADDMGIALERARTLSSLKNINAQLMRANTHLKDLDRMKNEFISITSHELRTPLTAIKSYLWLALNGKAGRIENQKLKGYLDKSYISSERMINLVSDMLSVSRIETGKIQILPVRSSVIDLIKDELTELKVKADEKSLSFEFQEPKSSIPDVLIDQERIREVIVNLIGNAIKYTDEGGSIMVGVKKELEFVRVWVKDTGRGILEEDFPKLFKKFGRLDNSYVTAAERGGTGLGLYISKALVELHGGTIDVESKLKEGSTFSFTVPICTERRYGHV